jgi:hypothetical protein
VTPTFTPSFTCTLTPTTVLSEVKPCKNVFNITQDGSICVSIATSQYPGRISVKIYNTAGEHIITIYDQYITHPIAPLTLNWNGMNKYGQKVASGIYLLYLAEPYGQRISRIAVIH